MKSNKDLFLEEQQEQALNSELPTPPNKLTNWERINNFTMSLIDIEHRVTEGEDDAIDTLIAIKELKKALDGVTSIVEDQADSELYDYGEDKIEKRGFVVQRQSGRGRYTYDNYEGYQKVKKSLKDIENKMKMAAKAGGDIHEEETGELIPPAEFKQYKTTIAIKKK
mgnify:CR=1 FL=1